MPLELNAARDAAPVLVTGATGFIGAQVVQRLIESGIEVIGLSRSKPNATLVVSRRITSVQCDLLDSNAVRAVINDLRPRASIHAAWDVANPDYLTSDANQKWVQASLHLARCLLENGCEWLGVSGTHIEPAHRTQPMNRYAATKATLRTRLFEMAGDRMSICWWRIFQPFGEGERIDRFIPSLLRALRDRERFLVRQPAALRDFVHVYDTTAAMARSCESRVGGVFDVGTGRLHSLRDVAILAGRFLDARHLIDLADDGAEISPFAHSAAADTSTLQYLTGWRPTIDLESGLAALARHDSRPLRASA